MEMHSSAAPVVSSTNNAMSLDEIRRSMTFHPSVWGDYFLAYTSDKTEISSVEKEELERQKEIVKKMLAETPDDSTYKLELIDVIQRLGVGYHFKKEIDKSLQYIHDNYAQQKSKDNDLRSVALSFRLLRQQGYNITCDVFSKFIDNEGNFEGSLKDDVEGMLNLYEAAHFGHHGEEILNKAIEFSSSNLEEILNKAIEFSSSNLEASIRQMSCSQTARVSEALKIPIRKSLTRLGAGKFISIYQKDESHNKILLNFSKLDFNIVQKTHQKELNDITRWWKTLDIANKLPYARDRIVECYFWIVGVYFEPHYNTARRMLTKVIALSSIIDDTYEYATLDELQVLTDAIQCWDVKALEESPVPHIKICYKILLDVYAGMEDEMERVGRSYCVQYAKEEMKKLVRAYFEEAKWLYNNYIPSIEEYMKVSLVSCGYMMMSTSSLVGMEDLVTKEDFNWVTSEPLIVQASSVICRLMDDLVGEGYEQKTSSIQCYMNQKGASKMEAFAELRRQVKNAWKDINQECLEPKAASMPILMRIVNLACVINLLYADDDGYANPIKTKDLVKCVLVEPMTI